MGFGPDGNGVSAFSNSFSLINPSVLPSIIFQDAVNDEDSAVNPPNYNSDGWGVVGFTSHSPTQSRADSPAFYGNNDNRSLITPKLDLSGRRSVSLTFWHRFDLADFDSVNIWVRTADGAWTYMRGFTGSQTNWQPATVDLSSFAGQSSIQIAFQIVSDESVTADGWYIDDIKIYEPEPTDFYTVQPCRLVAPQRPAPLFPGNVPLRTFTVAGQCGVPLNARAVSLNVTAVNPTGGGFFTIFPADQLLPPTTTISFPAGLNRANNAILGYFAESHP